MPLFMQCSLGSRNRPFSSLIPGGWLRAGSSGTTGRLSVGPHQGTWGQKSSGTWMDSSRQRNYCANHCVVVLCFVDAVEFREGEFAGAVPGSDSLRFPLVMDAGYQAAHLRVRIGRQVKAAEDTVNLRFDFHACLEDLLDAWV